MKKGRTSKTGLGRTATRLSLQDTAPAPTGATSEVSHHMKQHQKCENLWSVLKMAKAPCLVLHVRTDTTDLCWSDILLFWSSYKFRKLSNCRVKNMRLCNAAIAKCVLALVVLISENRQSIFDDRLQLEFWHKEGVHLQTPAGRNSLQPVLVWESPTSQCLSNELKSTPTHPWQERMDPHSQNVFL